MPSLDSFQRQFVLTQLDRPAPASFAISELAKWKLLTHGELRTLPIFDRNGEPLGWLLGEPIDVEHRELITREVKLDVALGGDKVATLSRIAEIAKDWAGWYLLVLVHPHLDCVMTDSGARLPCFFDERSGTISSSPALILGVDVYKRELRSDLIAAVDIDGKGWFPFGLTALPHIKRVLPNHRLSLGTLAAERFWPVHPIAVHPQSDDCVEAIADRVKSVINIIMEPDGAVLPLTAGHESRTLLALSRARAAQLRAVTLINPTAQVDHEIASKLATVAGIPHDSLQRIRSNEDERQAWLIRTGHVVGDENPRHYNTWRSLTPKLPGLTGLGGEVARAFYWLGSDRIDGAIDSASLLRRLDMPQHPLLLEAAKHWLESIEQFDLFTKLDLAYIELRLGCWGAPPPFGPDFVYRDFCPFIQQSVFESMLALPHEFRRNQKLASAIIAREWPDLLRFPFNRLPGLGHYVSLAKKATDAARIRRRLRRLLARH